MVNPDHYTYRVHWSDEDAEYVATVAELPSLSWLDTDPVTALDGMVRLAHEVVAEMESSGDVAPQPYATRSYSGKFMVRIPPEAHRDLTIDAAEQNVSLNALVSSRLVAHVWA